MVCNSGRFIAVTPFESGIKIADPVQVDKYKHDRI